MPEEVGMNVKFWRDDGKSLPNNRSVCRPSGTHPRCGLIPGIEMPGYFKNVPAGRGIFVCAKIQMRPNNGLYFREAWAARFWTSEWRQP
jgi:hypothetical protein